MDVHLSGSLYHIEDGIDNHGKCCFIIVTRDGVNTGKYAYTTEKAVSIVERLMERAAKNEVGSSCIGCNRRQKFSHYHVYVIELDKKILAEKKRVVRRKNPHLVRERNCDCYYVGSTRHRCECRFNQHIRYSRGDYGYLCSGCYDGEKKPRYFRKEGRKGTIGSRNAGRYGIRLRPDLYSHLNPIKGKETALRIEKELAQVLRKKGAMVIQA